MYSPFHQAASVLHEMYKKFPVLYNSSIVSSFEPKVIYKVIINTNNHHHHHQETILFKWSLHRFR